MARTVNEETYAVKRNEILDVTQRLIYTRGYEQMSIQDILGDLQISKGAFYHYFDSKTALLEALLDRMLDEALAILTPIVEDPTLSALEKLQLYFDSGVRWKTTRKAILIELLRVWYTDHNAIVRQKMWTMMRKHSLPLLLRIIDQGVQEGALQITYPDQIGMVVLAMIQAIGDGFAELLLVDEPRGDELQRAERLIATYDESLERVLGAPLGSIHLMDAQALRAWF